MDEVEKILFQMKQGLSQNVFFHFDQLKRLIEEPDAAKYILEELRKIEGLFEKSSPSFSLFSNWDAVQKEWQDKNLKAIKEKDYDMIYESEEVLKSIKILKYSLQEAE